jgi:hypothetical protein
LACSYELRYHFPPKTFGAIPSSIEGHIRPKVLQDSKSSELDKAIANFHPVLCMQTFGRFMQCETTAYGCGSALRHEALHPDEIRAFLVWDCKHFVETYLDLWSPREFPRN